MAGFHIHDTVVHVSAVAVSGHEYKELIWGIWPFSERTFSAIVTVIMLHLVREAGQHNVVLHCTRTCTLLITRQGVWYTVSHVCVSVCVFVRVYVCVRVCIFMCLLMYVRVNVFVCWCMFLSVRVSVRVLMCVCCYCVRVLVCICMCACYYVRYCVY